MHTIPVEDDFHSGPWGGWAVWIDRNFTPGRPRQPRIQRGIAMAQHNCRHGALRLVMNCLNSGLGTTCP